jgi:hypothetical protein
MACSGTPTGAQARHLPHKGGGFLAIRDVVEITSVTEAPFDVQIASGFSSARTTLKV